MAKRLRNLRILLVALCSRGANQLADVVLYKHRTADLPDTFANIPLTPVSVDSDRIQKTRAAWAATRAEINDAREEMGSLMNTTNEGDLLERVRKAYTEGVVKASEYKVLHKAAARAWRRDHPGSTPEQALTATRGQRVDEYEPASDTNPTFGALQAVAVPDGAVAKAVDVQRERDAALATLEAAAERVAREKNISKQIAFGVLLGEHRHQRTYAEYVDAGRRLAKLRGGA